MDEKEDYEAAREAQRDVVAHPERPVPNEKPLVRYLSSEVYWQTHHRRASKYTTQREPEESEGQRDDN